MYIIDTPSESPCDRFSAMLVYLGKKDSDERPLCLTFSYSFAQLPHNLVSGTKMACEEWKGNCLVATWLLEPQRTRCHSKVLNHQGMLFFSDWYCHCHTDIDVPCFLMAAGSLDLALTAYHFHHKHLFTWFDKTKGFKVRYTLRKNIENTWVSSLSMMWILDFHVEIYQFSEVFL